LAPRGWLREPDAVRTAGAHDFLVLFPRPLYRAMDHRRAAPYSGRRLRLIACDLHAFRGRLLLRDHARGHSIDSARAGRRGADARHELWANYGLYRPAAGAPQHAAGAADADHHSVS